MSASRWQRQHAATTAANHLRAEVNDQRTPRPMRMTVLDFLGVWVLALGTLGGCLLALWLGGEWA